MSKQMYHVSKEKEYRKAGAEDLIELLPAPGGNPLFILKWILESLVYGVASREFIHLSGPTGSAKTSLIEALHRVPDNFGQVCDRLGLPARPLKVYPVEMAVYETPGELYQRRSLKGGTTYDEMSRLVESLKDAEASSGSAYPLIWLREMGRVHSSSVQGGLLDLMTKGQILLPDGATVQGGSIGWISDSNYQAENESTHTLVTLDDALKRRFSMNVTLDYLPADLEVLVLQHLVRQAGVPEIKRDLLIKVVAMGQEIRKHRVEGRLQSVPPPSIYGYLAFLRMAGCMPHMSMQQIAQTTLMGNASLEDRKLNNSVFNQVFGLKLEEDETTTIQGNLF
ncbi:hypothetical protein JW777_10735 [bacterium]|nr:hypothetical protein [bacterium]